MNEKSKTEQWRIECYKFFLDKQINQQEDECKRIEEIRGSTNFVVSSLIIFISLLITEGSLTKARLVIVLFWLLFIFCFWIFKIVKTFSITNGLDFKSLASLENAPKDYEEGSYYNDSDEYAYYKDMLGHAKLSYDQTSLEVGKLHRARDALLIMSSVFVIISISLVVLPHFNINIESFTFMI